MTLTADKQLWVLSDPVLLNYLRCSRRAYLNRHGDPAQADPEKDFVHKLRRENQQQIAELRQTQPTERVQFPRNDWPQGSQNTLELMAQGVERVERGVLWLPELEAAPLLAGLGVDVTEPVALLSRPTLLVRQPGASRWGDWQYYPVSVKLGKRPKSEYKLIAAFQALLLTQLQAAPTTAPLIRLRGGKEHWVDLHTWQPQMAEAIAACLTLLQADEAPELFMSRQRCSLCTWQTACHAVAQEIEHLSLVPGVTPTRYAILQELQITELEQLATVDFEPLELPQALPLSMAQRVQQQARSRLHNAAIALPNPPISLPIPHGPIELYFDLEAEPERNVDFLFGVLCVNHRQQTEQFYAFVAKQPEDEYLIWQQFLALVDRYPDAPIYHFSVYETDTLKRLSQKYGLTHRSIKSLIKQCVDIHDLIMKSVTLPVESYSLKAIAQWLGFQWRDQGLSGDQTICLYDNWLKTQDSTLLDTIIRYNEDDCRATYRLKAWLEAFWDTRQT